MAATNIELWDKARAMSPSFASHTSKGTSELFSEKGFDQLLRRDVDAINEFFELSIRTVLNKIDISTARNPLEGSGIVERYANPYGGYLQRISVMSIKPVTPAFKGLQDGDSVDMQIVKKPEVAERFFTQNFDYQSFITLQDWQARQIFVAEQGMSAFLAGIMEALRNGYTIQEYVNTMACINAMINTAQRKETQVVNLTSWTASSPTVSEMKDFIYKVRQTVNAIRLTPQTGAFNANGFETAVDASSMVMLVRAGVKDHIAIDLLADAYNREELDLPVEVFEVSDFGGLIPLGYATATGSADSLSPIFPHYDVNGTEDGWSTTKDGPNNATFVKYLDPNERVIGVLVQRGAIFTADQVPITTRPAPYNVRGLYQNYFASAANCLIRYDKNYNFVVFQTDGMTIGAETDNLPVDLLGKTASDLQSNISVTDGVVSGALKYVTGYTGFSGETELQSGHYLALDFVFSTTPDSATIDLIGGNTGIKALDLTDNTLVVRITNPATQIIRVTATKSGVTTTKDFALYGLTLNQ